MFCCIDDKITDMSILKEVMSSRIGCILISVLLGLGLATMFHRVCVGRDCVVVKGPSIDYVTKHIWRSGKECYKFKVQDVECPDTVDAEQQESGLIAADEVVA